MAIRRVPASQQLRPGSDSALTGTPPREEGLCSGCSAPPREVGTQREQGSCVWHGGHQQKPRPLRFPGRHRGRAPRLRTQGPGMQARAVPRDGLVPAQPGPSAEGVSKRRLTWSPAGPPPPSRFPVFALPSCSSSEERNTGPPVANTWLSSPRPRLTRQIEPLNSKHSGFQIFCT